MATADAATLAAGLVGSRAATMVNLSVKARGVVLTTEDVHNGDAIVQAWMHSLESDKITPVDKILTRAGDPQASGCATPDGLCPPGHLHHAL